MFVRKQAAARTAAPFAIGIAAFFIHFASAEPLPSPMDSEISSVSQSRPPAVFTAPIEEPSTRPKPDSSEKQRNFDEVRHLFVMPEEELFEIVAFIEPPARSRDFSSWRIASRSTK